jgi:hypothetical protein
LLRSGSGGRSGPPPMAHFRHLGVSRRRCSRPCRGPARRALREPRKPISEASPQVAAPRRGIMAAPPSERQERHEICRNCDRPSTAAWYRGESRSECSSKSPAPPRNNGASSEFRCGVGLTASTPRTVRGATPRWVGLNPRRTRCAGRRECAGPARKRRGAEFGRGTCTRRLHLAPVPRELASTAPAARSNAPGGGRRRRSRRREPRGHGPRWRSVRPG